MKYINKDRLSTYLKIKKELALFIGIGQYFDSKTFDWIKIEFHNNAFKCTKIRTFDEGNAVNNNLNSFPTLNNLEGEIGFDEEEKMEGTLEGCLSWIEENNNVDINQFVSIKDLNEIYLSLVKSGELGD